MFKFTSYFSPKHLFALLLTLWSTVLLSAPAGTANFQGSIPAQGTKITLTGSGFGAKALAGPIIYDFSDKAYIKGALDIKQGNLKEGDLLLPGDPEIYWAKPSSTAFGATNVHITYSLEHRNANITAHYAFDGFSGYVGWPYAYGGITTTGNNKKLYVSWWIKQFRDPLSYWRWNLNNIKGKFIAGSDPYQPGEKLIINSPRGVFYGSVISIKDNKLDFMAFGAKSSTYLRGATIKGLTSNTTALLPDDDTAFLPPGSNKFIRIWEDKYGQTGFASAWTQMNSVIKKPDGKNITSGTDTNLRVGKWNHMEVEVDLSNNTYREWLNSKLLKDIDITPARRDDTTFSPTIALLGFNGKEQQFQRTEFGEIYMDNTTQRIIIANAPNLNDVTRSEIQLPETWNDGSITFKLNLGSFKTGDDSSLYVFVYDENGISNTTGMRLCSSCTAPPGAATKIN